MSVNVIFLPDRITVKAEVGEPLLEVAERAGITIPTGCLMGSCHACEVEIDGDRTVCSCISGVPGGKEQITVNVYTDPTW